MNINLRTDGKGNIQDVRILKKKKDVTINKIHTLNLFGRQRSSLTLMDRPMSVAMLQWGMVGVNSMSTVLSASFTCKTDSQFISPCFLELHILESRVIG